MPISTSPTSTLAPMPPAAAAATPARTRSRTDSLDLLHFGGHTINAATRELLRQGQPVAVRRQVFDLLLLLVQRRPDTVSLEDIRLAVWGREQVAASAIARAVLEARRAIDDHCPAARQIINVHGVGYRFAGQVQEGPAAAPAGAAGPSPLEAVDALLQEAENAYNLRADLPRARYHAEQALAEAMRHGLNVASGQALVWLAWLAMWSGSIEDATRRAQHALQLALSENHAELQARARTVEAFVQLSLGDFDRAMQLLNQAHPVLLKAGRASDRYRCENLMSAVAKHLGNLGAALQWCQDAQRTAQAAGLPLSVLRARSNEVEIGNALGEACQREGRSDEARQAWQQALDTCQQLLQQIDGRIDPWLQLGCHGNQAVLLSRLARFGEARDSLCRMERELADFGQAQSPAVQERRAMVRLLRVQLSVGEGDHARAMHEVQKALAETEAPQLSGPWKPALLELASQVAESCGKLDVALRWAREHHAAQLALEGAQARKLIQAMQTQTQQAALSAQLEAARRNIHFLEQMNAELLQRVSGNATEPPHVPPSLI